MVEGPASSGWQIGGLETELFTSCASLSVVGDGSSLSDSKIKRQKFENQVN